MKAMSIVAALVFGANFALASGTATGTAAPTTPTTPTAATGASAGANTMAKTGNDKQSNCEAEAKKMGKTGEMAKKFVSQCMSDKKSAM